MRKTAVLTAVLLLICMLSSTACSLTEQGIGPDALLTGVFTSPVRTVFSFPEFGQLAAFGKERIESLNRLIRHFSLDIQMDGEVSRTVISVDDEPVCSFTEDEKDGTEPSADSSDADPAPQSRSDENGEAAFRLFLEQEFFPANRLLDDLYPLFEKTPEVFQDFSKTSTENMNFRGYGKAVRRITIQLPVSYVQENFPGSLSVLAGTDECRQFVNRFVYKGVQKIVLMYDADGRLLRISYDGVLGFSEESLRKVSLTWRCVRSQDLKKDNLTLKTPSTKGYDRYNMTYVREMDLADPENQKLNWDLQLDMKNGDVRGKVRYNADLSMTDQHLKGQVQFNKRQNDIDFTLTIDPVLEKENMDEYRGTIEITGKTGKIVTSSITFCFGITPCEKLTAPSTGNLQDSGETDDAPEISGGANSPDTYQILIRRLLTLPGEDLDFLSQDIPEDIWNTIIHSIV